MIKFKCGSCQKSIGVDVKYAGKLIKCPGCESPTRIPAAEPVVAEVVQATPVAAQLASSSCPNCQTQLFNPSDPMCGVCGFVLQQTMPPARPVPVSTPVAAQVASPATNTFAQPIKRTGDLSAAPVKTKEKAPTGRMFGGWLAALFAGMVCAFFWGLIAPFFGITGSALAWGIGGLFGVVAGLIGRSSSWKFCLATTLGALLCMLFGKLVSAVMVMVMVGGANMVEGFSAMFTPDNGVSMGVVEDMVDDGSFTDDEKEFAEKRAEAFFENKSGLFGNFDEAEDYDVEVYLSVNRKIKERMDSMSAEERTAMLERSRERHPNWMEEPEMKTAVTDFMLANDLIDDEELRRHAEAQMMLANGDNDQEYFDELSPNKRQSLG